MSIHVKCGGGHVLNVGRRLAGQTVRCPKCQAEVSVPGEAGLSDQAVLDFLGPPSASAGGASATTGASADERSSVLSLSGLTREMKLCPKCKREVRACYDLCPHCKTYFTDLAEIRRRLASA
ncbi:MAG: hypothetical protein WD847_02480 [Pirellulales bacterium]